MQIDYSQLNDYLQIVKDKAYPHQVDLIKFAITQKRVTIRSTTGSGKTLTGLTSVLTQRPLKVLVLGSKNSLPTWRKELFNWFPIFNFPNAYTIVRGTPAKRKLLWQEDHFFYATTYKGLLHDIEYIKALKFDAIICDECDRGGLRNHKTKGFKLIKELSQIMLKQNPKFMMLLLSATLASKGSQDMWGYLHLCAPTVFKSYWAFTQTYCHIIKDKFGSHIIGPKNTAGFAAITKPYLKIIPNDVTDKYLPKLQRQLIPTEMTSKQSKMYNELANTMMAEVGNNLILASNALSRDIKLRQILTCPKILGLDDFGGAIETVVDMMHDDGNYHRVIFTPFRAAIEYYREYLNSALPKIPVYHLWGGIEAEELIDSVNAFKHDRGIMLCTIKYSQSFELETSHKAHFIGTEWDPNDNLQAEGRIRRLISTQPITIYYHQHLNTIEEHQFQILGDKTINVRTTFQDIPGMNVKKLLRP